MELPRVIVSTPENGYDEEMTQVQADFIAFSDVLLDHKEPGSPLTFVDFIVHEPAIDIYQRISDTSLGRELLVREGEQMAIESQGAHYPQLDVPKASGEIDGVSIRVYGWDYDRYRFKGDTQKEATLIEGEVDKVREVTITFHRSVGGEGVSESVTVRGTDARTGKIGVSREIWMSAYAETGYEGHNVKGGDTSSDESINELLEAIAGSLGENPKTVHQWNLERLESIEAKATRRGLSELFDQLKGMTWPAQTVYLSEVRLPRFEGGSVESLLAVEEVEGGREAARDALQYVIDWWKKRSNQ